MDALTIDFAPATGTEEEWNEAYARLGDYFRAHRLHNRIRRTQLILETLRRASAAHSIDPSLSPTAHAIFQARTMLRDWLGDVYEGLHLDDAQLEAAGRLGFHLCDGPSRWPRFFLNKDDVPKEMTAAMRSAVRESGPRLQVSKMTPREIDLGLISEVAEDTFDTFDRHPLLRYGFLVLVVGSVLGYLYWLLK